MIGCGLYAETLVNTRSYFWSEREDLNLRPPEPIQAVCRLFNQLTDEGRNMKACSDLLSTAIRSMIDVKEEKDLDSLFSGGRTTALVNTIAGLDDFELVAFLVVQEEG